MTTPPLHHADSNEPETPAAHEIATAAKIHAFEEVGLGKAPFRCVAVHRGQDIRACDYCATAIQEVCVIRSSDGRTFIVGNQCVNKTGDRGLIDVVKREVNALRTRERNRKADARIEAAKERVRSSDVRAALKSRPHPNAGLAASGRTLLDYAEWLMENAGRSGRLRAAEIVESANG